MNHEIATLEVEEQPIISVRSRLPQADIPHFLGRSFGELFGRLGLLGVKPTGPPFVIYHEFRAQDIDAEVCLPIATAFDATGRIGTRVLPAATVVRTLHVGPYDELGDTYQALTDWIQDHGFETAGPVRERYLNGPGDTSSPLEYRTEVDMPIQRALVAAGG